MKNKRGGFTLVEVMTVVLLFGLLLLLILKQDYLNICAMHSIQRLQWHKSLFC